MALESKLQSRLGFLAYDEIEERIDHEDPQKRLDEYDIVLVKDQDTAAYIGPDKTIHKITTRLDAYVTESTAIRALNSSPTTYVGMPVAIYYEGSYKLYLVDGTQGDWHVLPAWGNPVNFSYNDLIDVPLINKTGTVGDIVILNELTDGMYAVNGLFKVTSGSSELFNESSPELVVVKDNGNSVTRITGKETLTYDTSSGGEPVVEKFTTESIVDEMIDEQFKERVEETSSDDIQNLFNN